MPGYDESFTTAVTQNLVCGICHLPLRNAVQILVCGHRFCDSCLNSSLSGLRRNRLKCPLDNIAIDYAQIFTDDQSNDRIMSLSVYCRYKQDGCSWTGMLLSLEDHLSSCDHMSVDCPNLCNMKIQRRKLNEHCKKKCPKRRIECSKCRQEFTHDDLKKHSCRRRQEDSAFVECSNGCGVRVSRDTLTEHLTSSCMNRWIFCSNCHVEIICRDREEHIRNCRNTPSSTRTNSSNVLAKSRNGVDINYRPTPPTRAASFPAFLNYVGRMSDIRGSGRGRVIHEAEERNCSQLDLFTCSCGQQISGRDITLHMSDECPKRLTRCTYCRSQIIHQHLQEHHRSCPRFPLSCPNTCGVSQIPREEINRHVNNDCRATVVPCPFSHAGCQHECPERNLEQHVQDNVHRHLDLMCKLSLKQQRQISELKEVVRQCKPYVEGKLIWCIDNFSQRVRDAKNGVIQELHSPPFFTSQFGYKFIVVVFPFGNGSGESTHLSLYVRLLQGEYDSLLRWPFQGEITLSLLDQVDGPDKKHISQAFSPDPKWKSFQKPKKNSTYLGFGYPQFVSQNTLEDGDYLREDTIMIAASVQSTYTNDLEYA